MGKVIIPQGYASKLSLRDTQRAIKIIKDTFQMRLAQSLNLERISAPLMVTKESGINDDLNGVERKVHFTMKEVDGTAEVVQSLAKWKRQALARYKYSAGEGIYTDMNAIRRDDKVDNIHSIFVDQWDWERVINVEDRNIDFLKDTVRKIVKAISDTKKIINDKFDCLTQDFCEDVFFITSQELEDMYPELTAKERENKIVEEHKTVFIMQIGGVLKSGEKHDGRAPDYDDWSLNGDILMWNSVLSQALEFSSMGIRVDRESLLAQLEICDAMDRTKFPYHKGIIDGTLPLTIGGGIGQSRICMLMLEKAHIGEVHASIWPQDMIDECAKGNIQLL